MLGAVSVWAALVGPPEPGLVVQWEAPAGCPDAAAVRARVVRLVGEAAAGAARLTARAAVRAEGGRWALDLELSGETGTGRRALAAARCDELAGAAALVIAIAVDPRAALAGPAAAAWEGPDVPGVEDRSQETGEDGGSGVVPLPPAPEGEAPGVGEAQADGAADGPPVGGAGRGAPPVEVALEDRTGETGREGQVRRDRSRVRIGLRATAGIGFARILPRPGATVGLTLSAAGRGWRVELGGVYLPPVPGGTAAIGGLFQLGAAELRGCPAPAWRRIEVPLCAGLQIGGMQGRGRGSGLTRTDTARALWLAATLGAALAWRPRERVALWVQADAIVAILRPSFVTVGGMTVHEAARAGGQALVGVEVRLR